MIHRLPALVLAILVYLFPAPLAAQSFTLQQVMSAPFSSDLQASPEGGRFLWIANQEGRRNLWIAEGHGDTFAVHKATNYDADDGQEIGDVSWTPDGAQIVFVRGGDFELPAKPAPNPALLPQGVEQDIWIVSARGGEPRKLAEGRKPTVSPDGATLAFLGKDQIWTIDLRDSAAKAAQLFHGRGSLGSLTWSPDGKYLAFSSKRGDHGFIGVFSFGEKALRYLDSSTEIDGDPVWSPDSRHIAFVRAPPDGPGIDFKPHRAGQPWSIRVADADTGRSS